MLAPESFFDLTEFFHEGIFCKNRPVWESLSNLKGYLNALELGKIECLIPPGATLVRPERISIGKGTIIEPGSYIEGPCLIGEGCQIRHGAYIRGDVLIGDRSVIGHGTEIKHAIFLNDAKAPHFNYVGDSILGNHVNIGAGVVCANFRLDGKEIVVEVDGERFQTGIKKFGSVLGDHSQIGCNSVINPGVLLRKRTYSKPCTSIQKSNLRKINDAQTTHKT